MAALQCEICGGKLVGKPGGLFECEYCGMEYNTDWAKAKIQEIKGTVKIEGTVAVTGTVKVEGAASKENILKRGFEQLEDGKWDAAVESFNQILAMDSENSYAYLGLAMAAQQVFRINSIDKIMSGNGSGRNRLLVHDNNFKRAETYADAELKARFTHWQELREARIEALEEERIAKEETERSAQKAEAERKEKLAKAQQKVLRFKGIFCARGKYFVGLSTDGTVKVAGTNDYGANRVEHFEDIVALAAEDRHCVGLRADGTVVATTYTGNPAEYAGRSDVDQWRDIVAISTFWSGTFGITKNRQVLVAGTPIYHDEDKVVYEGVRTWSNIVDVAAGFGHAIGLKADGTVVADIAYRHDRQILTKKVVRRSVKDSACCQVDDWRDIIAIAAGSLHSVGLKSDGTVVAVGSAHEGGTDVHNWTDIMAIAAHNGYTAGLKSDGTVVVTSDSYTASKRWTNVVAIAAGDVLVGLKSNGTVVVAGGENNPVEHWKLYDSSENLEQERKEARKLLAEQKKDVIRKRRQVLENEKNNLLQENTNLKGLFAGIRRRKIEERLAEIKTELKGL